MTQLAAAGRRRAGCPGAHDNEVALSVIEAMDVAPVKDRDEAASDFVKRLS